MPCQSFQSMVSYLPGAGKEAFRRAGNARFPRQGDTGGRSICEHGQVPAAGQTPGNSFGRDGGTGSFGEQPKPRVTVRTDVFRLSFRPMSGFGHAVSRSGRKRTPGRDSPCPRFKRKTVKALSPTLGIAGKSPQHSEDLQRKARPEGERPNNHPQKLLLSIP